MNIEKFLVANRTLTFLLTSISIASAWIWAPALFVSATVAYKWGLEGLLWFLIPNVLTLVLFAFVGKVLRDKDERGYTLSQYIKERTSNRLQYFYIFELLLISVCCIAVQLIAGGKLLSGLLPVLSYFEWVAVLGGVPALYTFFYGIKSSVLMDIIHYTLMFICLVGITLFLIFSKHLSSIPFTGVVNTSSLSIALSFGIPTAIGLLAGAFGSQDFYQRAYAVVKEDVFKSYLAGAGLFIVIPIMVSLLGFTAINEGFTIKDIGMVNFETLGFLNIPLASTALAIAILCGLTSTIDSSQTSVSAIFGNDISKIFYGDSKVWLARLGIIIVTVLAIIIANTGITILQLFLTYGAIRSSVFLVSLMAVLTDRILNSNAVVYSLLAVVLILVPINIYAILNKIEILQTTMAILIVGIPGIVTYITSKQKI